MQTEERKIILRLMQPEDLDLILGMAQMEGWITDIAELKLHLSLNQEGCFAGIEDGKVVGGVMTFSYQSSGWIGNLIVDCKYRSKGFGRTLLQKAVDHISQFPTRFLCAAPMAVQLYSDYSFKSVTKIDRWKCNGKKVVWKNEKMHMGRILDMDMGIWHDDRSGMLIPFLQNRYCISNKTGCIGFGQMGETWIIGPWYGIDAGSASGLLAGHLAENGGGHIFVDVPSINKKAGDMLKAAGFKIAGTTILMYSGLLPKINFDSIYGLTSMGSKG